LVRQTAADADVDADAFVWHYTILIASCQPQERQTEVADVSFVPIFPL